MGATVHQSDRSRLDEMIEAAGGTTSFQAIWEELPREDREQVAYTWELFARPKQLAPPGNWSTWLVLAGRGWGKTRVGGEFVRGEVEAGRAGRVALVAPTAADARDVMVEGESGILAISAPSFRPKYEPSKRRVTWPNGAIATLYSADEPDRLRGPQHDLAWADEIAAWKYDQEAWDMLQFGLRLGPNPRTVATTTPRPTPFVRELRADPTTVVRGGSTYENADNLAGGFLDKVKKRYEGTRLGRQEIHAEVLDDNPGALWKLAQIDALRIRVAPELKRVGVGIDPAVSHDEASNETGIVAGGVGVCRCRGEPEMHAFILMDESGTFTPAGWAAAAIRCYDETKADRMIPEINQGGDLVEANIRANGGTHVNVRPVHAAKGKHTRAEPVAALYEQGKVHHVGAFGKLEDQMTQWNPMMDARSPDRVDALVHLLTELMLGPAPATYQAPKRTIMPRRI